MDDWRTHQPLPAPIGAIAFYRPRYADKKGAVKRGSGKPPLGPNACIVDALASLAEDEPVVNPYDPNAARAIAGQLLDAEVARITRKWAPLLEGQKNGELRRGFLTQGLL